MEKQRAAALAAALAAWQAAAYATHGYLPGPLAVARAYLDPVFLHRLFDAYAATAVRAMTGYAAGLAAGVVLGLLASVLRVSKAVEPLAAVAASIPAVAWIPLLIALVGVDEFRLPVLASFMCSMPPVLYEVINAVSSLDPEEVGVALSLGARGFFLWRSVVLPHVAEKLFPAAKIEAVMSWKVVFAAEMIAVPSGLGYLALVYADTLDLTHLLAVVAVLTATVAGIVEAIGLLEKRVLKARGLGVREEWLR